MVVWDVINVRPNLRFITLSVKKLSILNGLADGPKQVEPDFWLNVDIDFEITAKTRRVLWALELLLCGCHSGGTEESGPKARSAVSESRCAACVAGSVT